jgi:hypothetical protein
VLQKSKSGRSAWPVCPGVCTIHKNLHFKNSITCLLFRQLSMAPEVIFESYLHCLARRCHWTMAMSGATESRKSRAEAPEKMNEVEAKEKVQQKEYGAHNKTTMRIDSMLAKIAANGELIR